MDKYYVKSLVFHLIFVSIIAVILYGFYKGFLWFNEDPFNHFLTVLKFIGLFVLFAIAGFLTFIFFKAVSDLAEKYRTEDKNNKNESS